MITPNTKVIIIPEGNVLKIKNSQGVVMWESPITPIISPIKYVSLGDSIGAGHTIDADWATNYGEGSQYGKNGNTSTKIVAGCYTDIIDKELKTIYGADLVKTTSFARSGDTVEDLLEKLTHDVVKQALSEAHLVTISIGANDVLVPAMAGLGDYALSGDLTPIENSINANLAVLADDNNARSYMELFRRITEINPNAKVIFTNIYNPYKYLWIGETKNEFFAPLLNLIPNMDLDIDGAIEDLFNIDDLGYPWIDGWHSIELNYDLDGVIKDFILSTEYPQLLFDRVNGLGSWTENYVNKLNNVLKDAIARYQTTNPNFDVADTKQAFDQIPDRKDGSALEYNDLVSVEYTRNYNISQMDWGKLWGGKDVSTFWGDLAWKYLTLENAVPSLDVSDYVSFDTGGFIAELMELIVERVITPDIDPHPEAKGHQILKRAFTNMYGLLQYNVNSGDCEVGGVALANKVASYHVPNKLLYNFIQWFTDSGLKNALNTKRTDLADWVASFTLADLANGTSVISKSPKVTSLFAGWEVKPVK